MLNNKNSLTFLYKVSGIDPNLEFFAGTFSLPIFPHNFSFKKKKVGKKPRIYIICIPKRDTQNSFYKKSCNFCIFLSQTMSLQFYVYKVIRRKIYRKKRKIHPQQTTRSKSCSECIRWMNDLALYRFTIS